jgi:hypothetical protein
MPAIAFLLALALIQNPPSQADLSLSVSCGSKPNEVTLTILNQSTNDTAVLLGSADGNGDRYLPAELVVEVRRAQSAEFEPLVYAGVGGVTGGRTDHWIVTLPARATFTLPLRTTDFAANTPGFKSLTGPPEELRVRLTGRAITADLSLDMAGMKLWRLWTGTAVSNGLRVAADCGR